MVCGECGKELAEPFKFCPNCGKTVPAQSAASEAPVTAPEIPANAETPADQPEQARGGIRGTRIRPGTLVFGAFSAISLLVSISKGLVPIYLLEAAAWAGAAWYWQARRTHSEVARAVLIVFAVLVTIGEVIHIAVQRDSQYPRTASTSPSQPAAPADQKPVDLSDIWAAGSQGSKAAETSGCPTALPSGVDSKPLGADESPNLVGTDGSLTSEQSYDSYYAPNGRAWNANLMYTNRTNKCVSQVVVELRLSHEGIVSDERHSIVFQPLLGPGQSQSVDVKLKIVTSDRGEDVALLGWHTIKASGFASGAGAPTYDENRFQIVKDPEDPFAAYGGHQTKPPNPTNLGQTSPKATITADAARGRLLQKSVPVYPPIAQAARVSGTVVLQATISKTGAVEELKVVSGPPMLQQAALDAVKTWRYKPYLVNKKAVPVQAQVIVVFSLGG